MRISDLITVHDAPRTVDLAAVELLSEAILREGEDLTLGTASELRELLGEYVAGEAEPWDVLRVILSALAADGERGGAFLVRGRGGSGKSHLLAALMLLLQHPAAWAVFIQSHPSYADLQRRLANRRYIVVPIPLADHRGHDEHLEDIFFDRTERVLRARPYNIAVPLSALSHALDLIDRHIAPRYARELATFVKERVPGVSSWEALRENSPAQAVETARQFAHQIGYPLDFRQSRVERLSRLLEIVREGKLAGIVWLADDLHEFLSSAGPKAVHSDCSFLDFIGQRAKIAPLHLVATLEEGLENLTTIEPYLLTAIRASYRTDLTLTLEHMRTVARRRVVGRAGGEAYEAAIAEVRAAYQAAFGNVSFSQSELADAYPLHPTALRCLESIASRFFGAADTLMAFMQDLLNQTGGGILQREFRQLVTVEDVFEYLRPRIASHPEVAAYIYDALDYYHKNAADTFPEAPELCVRLIRALIVLRLGNVAASAALLAELLGLDATGRRVASPEQVGQALEAMRLVGSFVDMRRGLADSPPVYVVDVQTSATEGLRRRIAGAKASFAPDDRRLWNHVYAACDDPTFPLAQLGESRVLEVQWEHTFRCAMAQVVDLTELPAGSIGEYAADLGDPAAVEDVRLFIAPLSDPAAQLRAWRQLCDDSPASRWSAAVLCWLPRELSAHEFDTLREYAAVAEMLSDQAQLGEAGLADHLKELHGPLAAQVRRIVRAAYHEGEVRSPLGIAVHATELVPLAGNWSGTLQVIAGRALERVFPEFPAIAPRRALVAREQIDTLIDQVIRPGRVHLGPEDPLRDLVESFLVPLGVAKLRGEECVIEVERSGAVQEVINAVRRRDQTPQHEIGRPLACSDLAQHLVKSPLGLPPELFELVVAALVRTGHLAAMRDRRTLVRLEDVPTPLHAAVQFVARPPLLPPAQWQLLARVCRTVLDMPLPGADLGLQMRVWERLVAARQEYLERLENLKRRLAAHAAELEHRPAQWHQSFADLEDLERAFQYVRPELPPALGLQEFLRDVEGYLSDATGPPRLASLFRRMEALTAYLDGAASEIVAMRCYLLSPDLNLEPHSELDSRRQALLELIASGENILSEEANLRRQVRTFLTAYQRIYLTWHGRVYRSPIFEQYRAVHQSPEMRALLQLSKLRLEVPLTGEEMAQRVDAQVARRCAPPDLSEALDSSPVCPNCHLRLYEEPELPPVETLLEEVRQAIKGYMQALGDTLARNRLRDYAAAVSRRSDVGTRLEAILDLPPDPSPREILTLFTDQAITHINRALSGKRLAPRNFAELREALEGKTLTKEEAQRLFKQWLNGESGEEDEEGLVEIEG